MRRELTAVLGELDTERRTRVRAEAARDQALHQLEAERAGSASLVAALRAVQQAASVAESIAQVADRLPSPTPSTTADRKRIHSRSAAAPPAERAAVPGGHTSSAESADSPEELVEFVKQLFEQVEASYRTDLESARDIPTVVDRLSANLRTAYEAFARHLGSANARHMNLFEQQLTALLDGQSESSFGRHLAVAAFNYAPPQTKSP